MPGYRFVTWSDGVTTSDQPRWETRLTNAIVALAARFEPMWQVPPLAPSVIVTEIQYHPASDLESGDWVELHNRGETPVNLDGWILRDERDDSGFLLPGTTLSPGGYLVLSQDLAAFRRVYPSVTNCLGSFSFGLGNRGDTVRLFDPTGILMLRLAFVDNLPWPQGADGTGYTLRLIDPRTYSANPDTWAVSPVIGGTPGKANQ